MIRHDTVMEFIQRGIGALTANAQVIRMQSVPVDLPAFYRPSPKRISQRYAGFSFVRNRTVATRNTQSNSNALFFFGCVALSIFVFASLWFSLLCA